MPSFRSTLRPDFRTIWRWHFLAGLFCLPFVAFLSLTGSIYLFRPQIDRWIDWRYDHLTLSGPVMTPAQQAMAALHAVPNSHLLAYELRPGPQAAARVMIMDHAGRAIRVYIDPASLAPLKQVPEEARFERIIFKLHGQLLLGNVGSVVMEMVASWTMILILTGLYLWWPRGGKGAAGRLYPRLKADSRTRWRDLHAVSGLWVSLFLALFLVSGLPWSFVWGHALSRVETATARLTSIHDWEIGAVPAPTVILGRPPEMAGMDMDTPTMRDAQPLAGLDAAVATASQLGYPAPVLITPTTDNAGTWRIRSDTQDRPRRISATVDAHGAVLSVEHFADKGRVDRLIGYGVAAHEGQLFGWANQLLNLVVALTLLIMSIAAIVLWIGRKPPGELGVPKALPNGRAGLAAVGAMIALGVLLPELGASLLLLLLASAVTRHFHKA